MAGFLPPEDYDPRAPQPQQPPPTLFPTGPGLENRPGHVRDELTELIISGLLKTGGSERAAYNYATNNVMPTLEGFTPVGAATYGNDLGYAQQRGAPLSEQAMPMLGMASSMAMMGAPWMAGRAAAMRPGAAMAGMGLMNPAMEKVPDLIRQLRSGPTYPWTGVGLALPPVGR